MCEVKVRASRAVIAAVTLTCSCGGTLGAVCLFDRTCGGDDAAWTEYIGRQTVSGHQADLGRRGAAVTHRKRRAAANVAARNAAAGRDLLPF